MKNIYANELCKTHSFIARIKWNGHCNMASHTLTNKNWHWWCRMQISRKLTEIEMITYQSRPHETSSLILWSYHLGRDEARAANDPSVFTIAEKALDETHTDSPSAAPMVRTGTDPSSRAAAVYIQGVYIQGVVSTQRFRTFYKILSLQSCSCHPCDNFSAPGRH